MGVMRILDYTGDTAIAWDTSDQASVDAAEARFRAELRRSLPVVRPTPTSGARVLSEFDPTVDEIIWTRPVVAG